MLGVDSLQSGLVSIFSAFEFNFNLEIVRFVYFCHFISKYRYMAAYPTSHK